jgi:SprT protein
MNEEIRKKMVVSLELRRQVNKVIVDLMILAEKTFGSDKVNRMPFVVYDTQGRTAGWSRFNSETGDGELDINPILFNENVERVLNQTIPHELAHFVAKMVFGRGIKPHGYEWKRVMRLFGKKPTRCHNMDTTTVQSLRKKSQRTLVTCKCPTCGGLLILSQAKATKMLKGTTYRHKACGGRVDYSCLVLTQPTIFRNIYT